jgi:hypothetical protein
MTSADRVHLNLATLGTELRHIESTMDPAMTELLRHCLPIDWHSLMDGLAWQRYPRERMDHEFEELFLFPRK